MNQYLLLIRHDGEDDKYGDFSDNDMVWNYELHFGTYESLVNLISQCRDLYPINKYKNDEGYDK